MAAAGRMHGRTTDPATLQVVEDTLVLEATDNTGAVATDRAEKAVEEEEEGIPPADRRIPSPLLLLLPSQGCTGREVAQATYPQQRDYMVRTHEPKGPQTRNRDSE